MGRKSARQKDQDFANYMTNAVRRTWAFCQSLTPSNKPPRERDLMVYDILLNAITNLENNMKNKGIEVPKEYIQDHVGGTVRNGRSLESNYAMCTKCEFCDTEHDDTPFCTIKTWAIDGSRFYTASDDGCSRGLLKEPYR